MSVTQYYLLGEHVYHLRDKIKGLLSQQGTTSTKKLEDAKELLNSITKSVKEGKDTFEDYYCLYEAACHYVYSYVGEVETSDSDSSDDDTSSEEESILANVLM
jgi:ElaB/YqjD/DUF883 family membrane-anchored ribosome-binding protein